MRALVFILQLIRLFSHFIIAFPYEASSGFGIKGLRQPDTMGKRYLASNDDALPSCWSLGQSLLLASYNDQ